MVAVISSVGVGGALAIGGGLAAVGSVVGSVIKGNAIGSAAEKQAQAQSEAQRLLAPYVQAGEEALPAIQQLLGLGEDGSYQKAVSDIQGSPMFQGILNQGEQAILRNASATGGLRGGNTQAALAQFAPSLLNQFIQQRYGNLMGLANMGQNAAAGNANSIVQQGDNAASAALAKGQNFAAPFEGLGRLGGTVAGRALGGAFAGPGGQGGGYGSGPPNYGASLPNSFSLSNPSPAANPHYTAEGFNPYGDPYTGQSGGPAGFDTTLKVGR